MINYMRRIVITALCIFVSLSVASQDFFVNGIKYLITSSEKHTVAVIENDGQYCGNIVIPDMVKYDENSYVVTSLSYRSFADCSDLLSVIIPSSVSYIANEVFAGCANLQSISIPSSVTSIGDHAFKGCSQLKSITIPPGITTIEPCTFEDCVGLESLTIPQNVTSVGWGAFLNCTGLRSISVPNANTQVNGTAFAGCSNIDSIYWNSKVLQISTEDFKNNLKYVEFGDSVTDIGDHAFKGCSHLKSITIPSGVSTIEECTFEDCVGLEAITIPKNITEIGWRAFKGCTGLKSITVPSEVSYIDWDAFEECTNVDTIYWNSQVTPRVVTQYCYATLRTVILGDSVTSISDRSFEGCAVLTKIHGSNVDTFYWNGILPLEVLTKYCYEALKTVILGDSVTSINDSAFEGCAALTKIHGSNVDTLYWTGIVTPGIFTQYCRENLKSIILGDCVTDLSDSVFADCTNLQSIIISASAIQIDQSVFDKSVYSKAFVYVPMGCRDNYKNADGWKYFKYIFERGASMCHLSYYIDYEFYEEIYYQYGDSVVPVTVPVTEGFVFSGWDYEPLIADDNYSIMGYFTPSTVVAGVTKGEDDIVYDLMGRRISVEGLETLPPGIYIVNGRKMVVQ